jgi:transcriptional regulator with XRE-family HTH domain
MERKNVVGIRIREARKKAKPPLTQLELLARLQVLGVTIEQPALSKIESGDRPVTDIEVIALAKVLKVSADWLLGIDELTKK